MNIIGMQEALKDYSEGQLVGEMQRPSGSVPQYLVLSELQRRKRMKSDYAARSNVNSSTVADEVVAAAGMPQGQVSMAANAMAPKSSVEQNTGITGLMPPAPMQRPDPGAEVQTFQEGGVVNGRAGPTTRPLHLLSPQERAMIARWGARNFEATELENPAVIGSVGGDLLSVPDPVCKANTATRRVTRWPRLNCP